jgi:hypothetical protein
VSVLVDDRLGTVKDWPARRPNDPQAVNRKIHEGGGSIVWKLIVSLAGIAPALLAITGLIAWIRSELRKARQRRLAPV